MKAAAHHVHALALVGCLVFTNGFAHATSAVASWITSPPGSGQGCHTAYHLWAGHLTSVSNITNPDSPYTGEAVIMAASDGYVQCYEAGGTLLWSSNPSLAAYPNNPNLQSALPFDLCVADSAQSGTKDLVLVAAADGNLYALATTTGNLLWTATQTISGTMMITLAGHAVPLPATPSVTPPLLQVCCANLQGGVGTRIMTGGVSNYLYALTPSGTTATYFGSVNVTTNAAYANGPAGIRLLKAGPIYTGYNGQDQVVMVSEGSGYSGNISMSVVNPVNLNVINCNNSVYDNQAAGSGDVTATLSCDSMCLTTLAGGTSPPMNIVYSAGSSHYGRIVWYKNDCTYLGYAQGNKSAGNPPYFPNYPYRRNQLLPGPITINSIPYIIGIYGNMVLRYQLGNSTITAYDVTEAGSASANATGADSFTCGAYDATNSTLYLGSSESGDNQIVAVNLGQSTWQSDLAAFDPGTTSGSRLNALRTNLGSLESNSFSLPASASYETKPAGGSIDVLLFDELNTLTPLQVSQTTPKPGTSYPACNFVYEINPSPDNDTNTVLDTKIDSWNTSTTNKKFLLGFGHSEKIYQPFIGSGTGLDYTVLTHIAGMSNFWGFELSEFLLNETEQGNDATVIANYIKPLAEWCRTNNKKIIIRNKETFWNGECYLNSVWWPLFSTPDPAYPSLYKYRNVFVPAMEETNCRTQDLSLSGRIGLWEAGIFSRWGCRVVTDNACSERMITWSSEREVSHFMRNLVSSASMGANVFYISTHEGPDTAAYFNEIEPFYQMLNSGLVYIPQPYVQGVQKTELASLSPFCLQMYATGSPAAPVPDVNYLTHSSNLEQQGSGSSWPDIGCYSFPTDTQYKMVFNNLDTYWSGSPLPTYDFSSYAFNVTRRTFNFLPQLPYGMVAMVPSGTPMNSQDPNSPFGSAYVTDGRYFYISGKQTMASDAQSTVTTALISAKSNLPVTVTGDPAHWSAAWVNGAANNWRYLRVTLIDPGYLDPAARNVNINVQASGWSNNFTCVDVLTGEALGSSGNTVSLSIPTGSVRVVDLIKNAPMTTFSQWEASFFNTQQLSQSTVSGPNAAPQNDGTSNLLKYLTDIDPATSMSATDRAALPAVDMPTIGGSSYLTLTYRQNPAATGITINVQTSTDLQNWQTVTPDITQSMGTDPGTGDPIIRVGVIPVSGAKEFIRLNVTSP